MSSLLVAQNTHTLFNVHSLLSRRVPRIGSYIGEFLKIRFWGGGVGPFQFVFPNRTSSDLSVPWRAGTKWESVGVVANPECETPHDDKFDPGGCYGLGQWEEGLPSAVRWQEVKISRLFLVSVRKSFRI